MEHSLILQSALSNVDSWPMLLPEVCIAATIGTILVMGCWLPQYQRYWLYPLAFAGTVLAWGNTYWLSKYPVYYLCNQLLVRDPLAICICLMLIGITLCLLLICPSQTHATTSNAYQLTYVVLLLGILLGSCLLVIAFHWLILYLGLTLISLSITLLIGSHKTPNSLEASLKYLLYSMFLHAIMLWGMAYFYGLTGTLALGHPNLSIRLQAVPDYIVLVSLLLCSSSVLFLLAVVPYHVWVPDVYQGTPATVLACLSTVPKIAALVAALRILNQFLPQLSLTLQTYIQNGMALLALLTILIGNTAALWQSNLQRLMAYGSIAQSGLLITGFVALPNSQVSVLYYGMVYGIMGLAIWIGLKELERLTGGKNLNDFVGVGRQYPLLGFGITSIMISLIGLPPTVGFTGKWFLVTALWEYIQHTQSSVLLVILCITTLMSTVLSLYYYLQLPYVLFQKKDQSFPIMLGGSRINQVVLGCLVTILWVGFFCAGSFLALLKCWIA